MKKSTLITTIAMIVVVVVALSTATYAWFTSSASTYATTDITIAGTSGIEIAVNATVLTGTDSSSYAAFTATNFLPNAETSSVPGIKGDIWAPHATAALSVRPSADSATACTKGGEVDFTKGLLNNTKTILSIDKAPTEMSPDIIRVTNADGSAASKNIKVTIYIAASNSTASFYAAQGVCAYIAGVSNIVETEETGKIAYTDYHYVNKTKHAALASDPATELTAADVGTNTAANGNSFIAVTGAGFTESTTGVNHDDVDTYTPGTKMTLVSSISDDTTDTYKDLTELGMKSGAYASGKFYTLTYNLGSFNMSASKNFVIYTWLDGVYLNNSAKSADIKIAYKFSYVE